MYLLVEAPTLGVESLLRVDLEHVAYVVLLFRCTVVAETVGIQACFLEAHLNFWLVSLVIHHVTVLLHIPLTNVLTRLIVMIVGSLDYVTLLIHVLSLVILHALSPFDRICATLHHLLLDVVLDL